VDLWESVLVAWARSRVLCSRKNSHGRDIKGHVMRDLRFRLRSLLALCSRKDHPSLMVIAQRMLASLSRDVTKGSETGAIEFFEIGSVSLYV
jgi:hypothetical protein